MAEVNDPKAYFTQELPRQYTTAIEAAPVSVAEQPPLTAVFEITGPHGGIFSVRSAGTQIEVRPGAQIETPDMYATLSYEDWQTLAASGATDMFVDYVRRGKVAVVKGLKGTVNLELTRSDGNLWHSKLVFGGQPEPELMVMMSDDDYRAMLSGALNSQMAFLTGKLKFEGSLPLLMQIGALAS